MGVFESGLPEAVPELSPGGGIAHLLDGEDVGRDLPDDLDDGAGLFGGLGLEGVGIAVAVQQRVLVQVEGHHREFAFRRPGISGFGNGGGRLLALEPGAAGPAGGTQKRQADEDDRCGVLHGRGYFL